jgi:hypothetical protein
MVAWIDLVQLTLKTMNSVIDQKFIFKMSCNEDLVTDYISQLFKHLEMYDHSVIPLLYIAGKHFAMHKKWDSSEMLGHYQWPTKFWCSSWKAMIFVIVILWSWREGTTHQHITI